MDAKRCVLIVDASADAVLVAASLRERTGFEVHVVSTGSAALRLAPVVLPDVVLLSSTLPDAPPADLLWDLRRIAAVQSVTVALMGPPGEFCERAGRMNIDDFIVTPADPNDFAMRVRSLARLHALMSDLDAKGWELTELAATHARMAIRDPTTGVYHQAYVLLRLEEEVARAARYGHPLSVLRVTANVHGALHGAWDDLNGQIGQRIARCLRRVDLVGYLGGELIVIAPCTNADGARIAGRRAQSAVAAAPFVIRGPSGPLIVAATITIAAAQLAAEQDVAQLLAAATSAELAPPSPSP